MRPVVSGLLVLALLVGWATQAPAQVTLEERDLALLGEPAGAPLTGSELEAATESVAAWMRCPVCQGLSVADSHTESALAMRDKARALLARGYSADQVLTYFESSYGEFIRLAPRPEGFNLVVWFMPALGLLVGIALVWSRLRRGRKEPVAADPVDGGRAETDRVDASTADGGDDLTAYRERVRREAGS